LLYFISRYAYVNDTVYHDFIANDNARILSHLKITTCNLSKLSLASNPYLPSESIADISVENSRVSLPTEICKAKGSVGKLYA